MLTYALNAPSEHLARLAGVALGPVVAIHELAGPEGVFAQAAGRARAMSVERGAPVERGEVRVTRRVQVRFALPARD